MEFEWDPDKNEANIRKHGIDFEDAAQVLLKDCLIRRSDRQGETRWLAVGPMKNRLATIIYTKRGPDLYRIISARRARDNERKDYRQEIS